MNSPSAHVSRFQPKRHTRRWVIAAALASVWIATRYIHDVTVSADGGSNVERLEEVEYAVADVLTPFELLLAREDQTARVRLLGIQQPWQWNNDPERWQSDTQAAIETWVAKNPVRVRLSRRQVSDDGVLLTHVCRGEVVLSEFLVRQGWVTVDPDIDPSDGSIRRLYRAEDEARLAARGIWSGRALGMIDHPGL